jgi:pentose-5-phosphate-3-epimerase
VSTANAPRCAGLGADVLVAASAIFNARASIGENIRALRESVAALKA